MSFGTYQPRFYKVGEKKLPSATTILSLLDKPALVQWAANQAIEAVVEHISGLEDENLTKERILACVDAARKNWRQTSKKALDIGTAVHSAIEIRLKTGKDPAELPDEAMEAYIAFLEWLDEHKLEPVAIETTVYGEGYAGTADLVAYLDDKLTLIDFKTSTGIWPEYALQTAAYRAAWNRIFPEKQVVAHGVLRLDKKTGWPEYKDFSETFDRDFRAFMCLVEFWWLVRGEK